MNAVVKSRNVAAATKRPRLRGGPHFARVSSRRSGHRSDVLHAQETPRARSGGHRVRRRKAARGVSSASRAWMHSTARLFSPLALLAPRGASGRHRRARRMTSARLPEALTRLLPPSHLTTHSAGAALAYGARLAYLASLEEDDEARDAEPEPEATSAEATRSERASVAEEPIPRSPSPARSSPRAPTPPPPGTPDDWESRAPEDWRSPPRRMVVRGAEEPSEAKATTNDDEKPSTREKPDAEQKRPETGDVTRTPVRTTTTTDTRETSFHSPPPFGAAYASSPLPSRYRADAEEKKNGDGAFDGVRRKGTAQGTSYVPNVCASPVGVVPGKHTRRDGTLDGTSSRVSLSESDKKLIETYDAMQTDFELQTRGFAMRLVDETRRWFHFEDPPGVGVWPLPYTQLGLPKDCARLVVLSLVDAPAVAAAGAACAREMMKLLGPCGAACFNVSRNAYHVSVFFFSLPNDPIADPLASDAFEVTGDEANETETNDSESERKSMNRDGVSVSLATAPLAKIGGRFQPAHEDEARAAEAAAFEMNSNEIVLEVDRIAQATSGALLLLFRDPNGDLARFRDALCRRFPNAPKKQPQIAHCTLLRAFPKKSDALTSGSSGRALADCRALCARWTARVRGTRVRVDRAWLVREERFSSIDGARRAFKFGGETERGLGA